MKTNLFSEMLKATDDEFVQAKLNSVAFLMSKICENQEEVEFIEHLFKIVKNEMFEKLDKQIETFKFFSKSGLS